MRPEEGDVGPKASQPERRLDVRMIILLRVDLQAERVVAMVFGPSVRIPGSDVCPRRRLCDLKSHELCADFSLRSLVGVVMQVRMSVARGE